MLTLMPAVDWGMKKYRKVMIGDKEKNFQLILWRENPSEELRLFRLYTITYGTASAPFLAITCLLSLSNIYQEALPIGSKVIRNDF